MKKNEIYKTEFGVYYTRPESHATWGGGQTIEEMYETMQEIKQMDAKRKARTDKAEEEKKRQKSLPYKMKKSIVWLYKATMFYGKWLFGR